MFLDFDTLAKSDLYKMMTSTVVPRPIAFVTTLDRDGNVNAAPFSFFNAMASVPPIVAFGTGRLPDQSLKNTAENVLATKEFVVNLVTEEIAQQMNLCAVDMPRGIDELKEAGLTAEPSEKVKPPRIKESPIAFECTLHTPVEVASNVYVILGQVLGLRIRDEYVDPEKMYVHAEKVGLIGRMHGRGWYARTTDRFEMPRIGLEEWQVGKQEKGAAE